MENVLLYQIRRNRRLNNNTGSVEPAQESTTTHITTQRSYLCQI